MNIDKFQIEEIDKILYIYVYTKTRADFIKEALLKVDNIDSDSLYLIWDIIDRMEDMLDCAYTKFINKIEN